MNKIQYISIGLLALLCSLISCKSVLDNNAEDDRMLARVYNKNLYLSDMEGMLPMGISSEDSSLIIDKFVRNWVRETAMLHEAENNIPQDLDINQLVEDYRASLVKHNYENIVLEKLLDSLVTEEEMIQIYEKNKEQYQLESPIIQCRFIKAGMNVENIEDVEKWWKSDQTDDQAALVNWCNQKALIHHLNSGKWYKVVDIGAYMPQGYLTVDNVKNKKRFIEKDDEFIYFYERIDLVERKKIAPLAFVEDQIRKVILHKRKMELLEELKDKLYDEALRKNGVSIYQK